MGKRESELQAIEVITEQDFLRAVTAAGGSRNVKVSDLAKTVLETYQSEIAGSMQSIVGAVNAVYGTSEIDSEVLALYESLGWEPPNATRSIEIPEVEEETR